MGPSPEDRRIIERCATGDPVAEEAFARRFEQVISRRLRNVGIPAKDLADVTQDVLLAGVLQLRAGKFKSQSTLCTWVTGIAIRRAQDYWRREQRARFRGERSPQSQDHPAQESEAMLREALERLPWPRIEAFKAFYLNGEEVERIADSLGVSEPRARAVLASTRRLVRRALGKDR